MATTSRVSDCACAMTPRPSATTRDGATESTGRMLHIDSAGALAELVGVDAGLVHERNHQVRERCALRHPDVTVALVRPGAAADEQRRQVLVIVLIPIGHAAAIQEQ